MDERVYQDALGKWIAWDGQQKHPGFTSEHEATLFLKERTMKSAMQEWADNVRELTEEAENLIDGTAPGKRLRLANGLAKLIEDTPAGQYVPGSDMKKERADELLKMYDALEAWLLTPLWTNGPNPLQIISRRET